MKRKIDIKKREVKREDLYHPCEVDEIPFETTKDLEPLTEFVGQPRALKALDFGLKMDSSGFNIFAVGPPGTGKMTLIKSKLEELAKKKPTPSDWVYVNNFKDSSSPNALELPPGKGRELKNDMESLIKNVKREIQRAFESDTYVTRRDEIVKKYEKKKEELLRKLSEKAQSMGFVLQPGPVGFLIIPTVGGKPLTPKEFQLLRDEMKEKIQKNREVIEKELSDTLKELRKMDKSLQEELSKTDHKVADYAISHLFEDLTENYSDLPRVIEYLKDTQNDMLENIELFRPQEKQTMVTPVHPLEKYKVNLLVDNSQSKGAPVVIEPIPNYNNLIGRIEKESHLGTLITHFTLISPGAFHKANGGYLVLDVLDVFKHPFAYDALKSTLKAGKILIEDIAERYGYVSTRSLKPEPIPLDVKVVLVGDSYVYQILNSLDPDFPELFKVKAHFDTEMDRMNENIHHYASFVASLCEKESLKHFDRSAIARIVEYGSRVVSDQKKLTTKFSEIADIVREASFWAQEEGKKLVTAKHVEKALDEKVFRHDLYEEKIREMISRGIILVSTDGEEVGVINGLAVLDVGDYAFGKPVRITVSVSPGREGVVDVEKEAGLGGKIHTKGVLIWGGYLTNQYAFKNPLTLTGRIAFEQSYSGVEGDSASCAELCALLSELADVPIKQNLAITGSVNQKGEIQPIGGVNEKIEGFFRVCKAKGLTGGQGVIIPQQNVENLMLDKEVIDAVKKGKFHIYSVRHVDEALEMLTGLPAGKRLPDGSYEKGTIHYKVQERLKEFQKGLKEVGEEKKKKGSKKKSEKKK